VSLELVLRSLERRRDLIERLSREDTDCYRLFHGVAEGRPGLTIDRYGPVLLVQTWREPLSDGEVEDYRRVVEDTYGWGLTTVWNHRGDTSTRSPLAGDTPIGHELGIRYDVTPRHRGQDPLLFLDLRAGRRIILRETRDKSVLNLFAYTGGVSLCALAGGARDVWNVDFARSAMDWIERNLTLNGLGKDRICLVQEDVIPVLRQLAGLDVKGRGARRREFQRFDARAFDVVVLDPPRWAKSPFGAVDLVRDYPSLLKPSILATAPGGSLLVTNNAARVERDEWVRVLYRTAEKCGRAVASLELVEPEEDFPTVPTVDAAPPLKMAWLRLDYHEGG
jgi:23S rRNA (cytosine1962-C5)-methyltransferase